MAEGAAKLGVDKDAVIVKDGVVVPKTGGKGVAYAALVGGKDFRLTVDAKAPLKDPKDYTIVGQSIRAHRHSRQGDRALHVHAGFPAQGDAARARGPAAGDESDADVVERLRLPQDSRLRRRREERAISLRCWDAPNGRRSRRAARSKPRGPTGRACPIRRSCGSTCAAPRSSRTKTSRRSATPTKR